jgi:hypothetical protein
LEDFRPARTAMLEPKQSYRTQMGSLRTTNVP